MPDPKRLSKLVRPLAKGQITLPAEFRRRLGIDEDTMLHVTLHADRIDIVPLRPAAQGLREYSQDDIQRFLDEDRLDAQTARKVRRRLGRLRSA